MTAVLLTGGVGLGVLQAIALRRAILTPWAWVPVTTVAWVVGWMVGVQIVFHIDRNPLAELFLGSGTAGLITGVALFAWIEPRESVAGAGEPAVSPG